MNMTTGDILAILPIIVVAAAVIAAMLATAVRRSHFMVSRLTMAGLALAFLSLFVSAHFVPREVTSFLIVDGFGMYMMGLIAAAGFVVSVFSFIYLERGTEQNEEYYLMLMLTVLGAMVMSVSENFGAFFLGFELLSVALYGLIAYDPKKSDGLEAGLKYFVLGSMAGAFLAFGIALIYAGTGALTLNALASFSSSGNVLEIAGFLFLLVGIGFKLALVPFHIWSPDVYQGAPAPTTALIATVSKAGVFAFLIRMAVLGILPHGNYLTLVAVIAGVTMFAGNLLALLQKNIKRLLAYSSIANMGYLMITVVAFKNWTATAATIYLAAYFVSVLGAFGVVIAMSKGEREAEELEDYRGLFRNRPALAFVMTLSMLSMAGIPLTAGFIGKYELLADGVGEAMWPLVFSLILSSAVGLFYYLRVVTVMFSKSEERSPSLREKLPWSGGITLAGLSVLLVWIGIYPSTIFDMIKALLKIG